MTTKLPLSVLVVVHTPGEVLLLERAAPATRAARATRNGLWQSVTGSLERADEPLAQAASRELFEETAIRAAPEQLRRWSLVYTFEIYSQWRHRFAAGITHNTEHVFSMELPQRVPVALAPGEHTASRWLPWREAARACFSWSNRDAIRIMEPCAP